MGKKFGGGCWYKNGNYRTNQADNITDYDINSTSNLKRLIRQGLQFR
jgi:hypothetical protein